RAIPAPEAAGTPLTARPSKAMNRRAGCGSPASPDPWEPRVTPGRPDYYHMILQKSDVPGHLTLVTQPQRVVEPALAWWQYMLKGDAAAKDFFAGTSCKLCGHDEEFEFGQKGLN
ncbi:MAG TPA: hypothetical protein VFN67_05515, partial [Polyangiales bacterium]|nr:hypothetical protein [Polyangiales bacterium]